MQFKRLRGCLSGRCGQPHAKASLFGDSKFHRRMNVSNGAAVAQHEPVARIEERSETKNREVPKGDDGGYDAGRRK
jgi:hypothetical protein